MQKGKSAAIFRWPVDFLPRVVLAGRYALADRGFEPAYFGRQLDAVHIHDYAGRVRIGDHVYALQPGDLTFSPRGVATAYDLPARGVHFCCHFVGKDKRKRPTQMRSAVHLRLHKHHGQAVQRFANIIRWHTFSKNNAAARAGASSSLLEFLLWVQGLKGQTDATSPRTPLSDRAVDQAARLLQDRLDQPLVVPELAREVGLSQNYLARRFHKRFGQTLSQFQRAQRIDMARYLLVSTDQPIKQIAAQVGMSDAQHFNKQFRRVTGRSPSRVRSELTAKLPPNVSGLD